MVSQDVLNQITLEAYQCYTHQEVVGKLQETAQGYESLGRGTYANDHEIITIGIQPLTDKWLLTVTRLPLNG